jgi:hypothetical protein
MADWAYYERGLDTKMEIPAFKEFGIQRSCRRFQEIYT